MNSKLVLSLISAVALSACVDLSDGDPGVSAEAKLSSNSLLPSTIVGNNLNLAALTGGAITNSGLEGSTNGRAYLAYMIECALPMRTSISSMYLGVNYTYTGALNLAPAWTTRALTADEGRLVSACVLARSNYYGQAVTISMRGDVTVLTSTTDELANYNVEEGAFYGDIFSRYPNMLHACNGVDQVRVGDTYGDLPLRQCAQPDPNNPGYTPCNFVFDGNCSDICVVNGDHYTTCGSQNDVITIRLYGTAP